MRDRINGCHVASHHSSQSSCVPRSTVRPWAYSTVVFQTPPIARHRARDHWTTLDNWCKVVILTNDGALPRLAAERALRAATADACGQSCVDTSRQHKYVNEPRVKPVYCMNQRLAMVTCHKRRAGMSINSRRHRHLYKATQTQLYCTSTVSCNQIRTTTNQLRP